MGSRLNLQSELEELLGSDRVYFQPPSSVTLKYPCIVYNLDNTYVAPADNAKYMKFNRYHVKHMYKNYDNQLKDVILDHFQMISHDNEMIADSIYNDDFTLYY